MMVSTKSAASREAGSSREAGAPARASVGHKSRPRLTELDALRGVAVIVVVVYHYTQFAHDIFGVGRPDSMASPLLAWLYPFDAGQYGVSLFFVISGFVILMTLDRTKRASDFAVSRFSRLYPAFWCGMILTATARIAVRGEHIPIPTLLANVTMLPTWFGQDYVEGVCWTLTVEMQFYMLMFGLWRLRLLRHVEWVCVAWLSLLALSQFGVRHGTWPGGVHFFTDALILNHIPLFTAGMMFYRIYTDRFTAFRVGVIVLGYAATCLSGHVLKIVVVSIVLVTLTLLVTGRLAVLRGARLLLWLGDRSYAIYLVHMNIGLIVMMKLAAVTHSPAALMLLPAVFTISLAATVHRVVEKPALVWIRRLYERQAKSPAGEPRTSP